jgi:sulfate adenylyltransferase
MLLNGAYSPLDGFMTRGDYDAVCHGMRLSSGLLWPVPIVLDVPAATAARLGAGAMLALRDPEGVLLAALHVEHVWAPDKRAEAEAVFGTTSPAHPGVDTLVNRTHDWYVGGRLEGIQSPVHHDFPAIRLTPADVRAEVQRLGWSAVVGFAPRSVMHRAHVEVTQRAMRELDAGLLVLAAAEMTPAGNVHHYARMRCYAAVMARYPAGTALLTLSPLATRLVGPRQALAQAIVWKNFGCTHWMTAPADEESSEDPDDPAIADAGATEALLQRHEEEIGVTVVPFPRMVYAADRDCYVPEDEGPGGSSGLQLSETELRRRLTHGTDIPEWFTFREVADELRRTYPPRHEQGLTIFFTGLSGSGKSTLANALLVKLLETGGRPVTLLDGDLVRKHLSSELGFSKEHRTLNVRRIGYVASEVTRSGGIAICALIAPHDAIRQEVRRMIEPLGGFVLVHVSTSLEVCEARDRKGLYAKARAGLLPAFTGISDPYEPPGDADLTIDTATESSAAAAQTVFDYLKASGYFATAAAPDPARPADH